MAKTQTPTPKRGSMSLRDYAKARDKFELDPEEHVAFDVAWPCCCCKNSECTDQEEPCMTCDHNANAEREAKESMDKQLQAMSDAEDRELIDRLTPNAAAEIATAVRVVQRINYGAAYGHDPELCAATSKTLGALRAANAGAQAPSVTR